jgi:hypothetical protein
MCLPTNCSYLGHRSGWTDRQMAVGAVATAPPLLFTLPKDHTIVERTIDLVPLPLS